MNEDGQMAVWVYLVAVLLGSGLFGGIVSLLISPAAARKQAKAIIASGERHSIRAQRMRLQADLMNRRLAGFDRRCEELLDVIRFGEVKGLDLVNAGRNIITAASLVLGMDKLTLTETGDTFMGAIDDSLAAILRSGKGEGKPRDVVDALDGVRIGLMVVCIEIDQRAIRRIDSLFESSEQ